VIVGRPPEYLARRKAPCNNMSEVYASASA
jgi:hypothetical protein